MRFATNKEVANETLIFLSRFSVNRVAMKNLKLFVFFSLALNLTLVNLSRNAQAAETPVGSSVSEEGMLSFERIDFDVAMLMKGSTMQYMDGNRTGKGTDLSLRTYPSIAFRLTDKWKAQFGGQFRQYFRPDDPKKKDRKNFEWRDPYAGFSRKDIWKSQTAFLSGKVRYYFPITEYNRLNRVKEYDEGGGSLQVGFGYGQDFSDGIINLYAPLEMNYRFNALEHKVRQDYWFGVRPALSYRVTPKTSARVEYYTGDLNHRTDGTWTKFNDPVIGQTAGIAIDWYPVKELLVSPMVNWGRERFRFNAAELTVYAKYAFL